MKIPFVGPSYVLKTRKADVQRTINLMPTAIESGTGKAGMYLEPVPGLRPFPGMPVLPDEPGYPGLPGWPPGPLPVPGPGFTGKLFARWGSSSENGTVFFGAQPAVA